MFARLIRAREDAQVCVAGMEQGLRAQEEVEALRAAWYGVPVELVDSRKQEVRVVTVAGGGIPVAAVDLAAAGGAPRLDILAVAAGRLLSGRSRAAFRLLALPPG